MTDGGGVPSSLSQTPLQSAAAHSNLGTRLTRLLIFRAVVASIILAATALAEFAGWPVSFLSGWLYLVVVSSFVVVFVLGALLRYTRWDPIVLAVAHLASAVVVAMLIVQLTGGAVSAFSFLYLLVVLDGAIIGGQRVAYIVATFAAAAYGAQLLLQATDFVVLSGSVNVPSRLVVRSFVVHTVSFYLIAFLSGYLASQEKAARDVVSAVEGEFRRAEATHREVLEALPVGVLVVDNDHRVVIANRVAEEILGSSGRVGAQVPHELAGERQVGYPTRVQLAVGADEHDSRTISLSSSHVADGELSILVLEDQTEMRILEEAMQQRDRLASIGELSAAIAHEIRNPLASISGAIELLQQDRDDAEERGRLERIVTREIARLNTLISDFLLYARPTPPELAPVDLSALLQELTVLARRERRTSSHEIHCTVPEQLLVCADAEQLRQVFWNLLRNAVDASPKGERIDVGVRRAESVAVLEVSDRGQGIDRKISKVLFEPFRTTKAKGTGLGLALVHRIVEGHGGTVTLSARAGGGTVARVDLPMAGAGERPRESGGY